MASPSSSPPHLVESPSSSSTDSDSVLGFTHNFLQRIQQSKSLLDSYEKLMRDKADSAIRCQADVCEQESEEIHSLIETLKKVQCKRGLINDQHRGDGDNSDRIDDAGVTKGGVAWEQAELDRKLVDAEKELVKCQLEHKKVDKNVKVVKEIEQREYTKAEEVKKTKEKLESSKKVTVDDLTLAVLKYEILGVKFVKGDGSALRCDFTQIDPSNPERVFSFILNVNDDDEYDVEECEPMLGFEDVFQLTDKLNKDDMWSDFIVGMRAAFKKAFV